MSLSNRDDSQDFNQLGHEQVRTATPPQTRVIVGVGVNEPTEYTVAELQGKRKAPTYTEDELTTKLWERVRAKVELKTREIFNAAQAEIQEMKLQASKEGYEEGLARAAVDMQAIRQEEQESLAAEKARLGDNLAEVLRRIENGRSELWKAQRSELVTVLLAAIKKVILLEVDSRRKEILANLIDEALEELDHHSVINIIVNPEDSAAIKEILDLDPQKRQETRWRIKSSAEVAPGGLVLENVAEHIDNTVDTRMTGVLAILNRLALDPPLEYEPVQEEPASAELEEHSSQSIAASPDAFENEELPEAAESPPQTMEKVAETAKAQPTEEHLPAIAENEQYLDSIPDGVPEYVEEDWPEAEFLSPAGSGDLEYVEESPDESMNNLSDEDYDDVPEAEFVLLDDA